MERGTLIAGKYELRERLGRGGMGEVWAGRDRNLHRDVAVKLLIRDDDASPDLLHRFEREAVAVAQINHPHVVSLYDRGVHDGLQFLIMEKIDGVTLSHHIHEQAPMSTTRALEITQEICAALVAAHRANVVHYDIKPSNVMIGADGHIKVVDFGIAGFTHAHTFTVVPTAMLSPVGTALYGAPEQFLDQRGDERSDLYALGSVLFAMLTGNPPFGGGSPLSVIRRKLDTEAPPLSDLRPDVPEPVARLLVDMLQRDPDRRPQAASTVYDRLKQLRSGDTKPAAGTGEPSTERSPQFARTRALTHQTPDTDDAFEIAWTGHEPIATYVTHDRRSLRRHWLFFSLLALPPLYFFTGNAVVAVLDNGRLTNNDTSVLWQLVGAFGAYTVLLLATYGRKLCAATSDWRRHRRAIEERHPWSLRVDATGITTTDPRHTTPVGGPTGRRTYGWSLVTAVTLEQAAEFRWGPSYSALHIQPRVTGSQGTRVNSISPAGMVHPRSPQGKAGRWPLCVMGPMTEHEHQSLIGSIARHAGARWNPDPGV